VTSPRLLVIVLAVLAATVGACGGESDEDKAKSTVEDYLKAVTDGNGDSACKLVTDQTRKRIERGGRRTCAATISSLNTGSGKAVLRQFKKAKVENVKVSGDTATASIRIAGLSQPAKLRKQGGDWKLDSSSAAAR
jgi:hypothetical protein